LRTSANGWDTRARWAAPLAMLFYSFGPIPSNQLFIAAGLTGMRLAPIVGAFLAGRLFSYTFVVASAHVFHTRIEGLFAAKWSNFGALAVDVLALAALVLFTRIDWPRLLPMPFLRSAEAETAAERQADEGQ
jgi:hypothetical protein